MDVGRYIIVEAHELERPQDPASFRSLIALRALLRSTGSLVQCGGGGALIEVSSVKRIGALTFPILCTRDRRAAFVGLALGDVTRAPLRRLTAATRTTAFPPDS